MKTIVSLLIVFLAITTNAQTATKTFSGSGAWTDATSWSPIGVPVATDDVVITGNSVVNLSSASYTVKSISLSGTSALIIANSTSLAIDGATGNGLNITGASCQLTVNGTLSISNIQTTNTNGLSNAGAVTINASGSITINNVAQAAIENTGSFSNAGNIIIGNTHSCATGLKGSGSFSNAAGSFFNVSRTLSGAGLSLATGTTTNAGTMRFGQNGAVLDGIAGNGTLTNSGIIKFDNVTNKSIDADISVANENGGSLATASGNKLVIAGTINNTGTFTIDAGTQFSVNGTFVNNGSFVNRGTLMGSGTIDFSSPLSTFTSEIGSHIAPGNSPGAMVMLGNINFGNATIDIEVNGSTPGSYDVLTFTGNVNVTGATLNVIKDPGYTPAPGDKMTYFYSNTITGPFATITKPASLGHTYNDPTTGEESLSYAAPLPVSLTSFTGKRENGNKLSWTTASESNNRGFAIERSTDGTSYVSIGSIASKATNGNSNSVLNYSFTDNTTGAKAYYRLVQTDFDGRTQTSAIVILKSGAITTFAISNLYPNPASSSIKLSVESKSGSTVRFTITDMTGRIVKNQIRTIGNGVNTIEINLQTLAAGTYNLKVTTGDGETMTSSFVKN